MWRTNCPSTRTTAVFLDGEASKQPEQPREKALSNQLIIILRNKLGRLPSRYCSTWRRCSNHLISRCVVFSWRNQHKLPPAANGWGSSKPANSFQGRKQQVHSVQFMQTRWQVRTQNISSTTGSLCSISKFLAYLRTARVASTFPKLCIWNCILHFFSCPAKIQHLIWHLNEPSFLLRKEVLAAIAWVDSLAWNSFALIMCKQLPNLSQEGLTTWTNKKFPWYSVFW